MITVTITRQGGTRNIRSFVVEGHAKFAKPGKDIVCAGVSSVTVGTVNAIHALTGMELPAEMRSGWLQSAIPASGNPEVDEKVQLLLESMLVMLESIVESYGKYVVIREITL